MFAINRYLTILIFSLFISNLVSADTLDKDQARTLVQPLYSILNGKDAADDMRKTYSANWQSYSDETTFKGLEKTIGQLQFFAQKLVPDLKWDIKELLVTEDNRVIVRGEATGTVTGDKFLGAPAKAGSRFTIMSIDIHTIENGQVVKTYCNPPLISTS